MVVHATAQHHQQQVYVSKWVTFAACSLLQVSNGGWLGGGYPRSTALLVAVRKQQTTQLKMLVERIDPEAFLILQRSHQVLGNGFGRYSDNV